MEHFFPRIQVKTKKKRSSSATMERFFPRIQVETCAQMHTRVKLLGGCRCRPYSNYWGDTVKLLGDISPPGFGTPVSMTRLKGAVAP